MPEFQPIIKQRPVWVKSGDTWVPKIDELTGIQEVVLEPQTTYHQIPWPCDKSVSLIIEHTWLNISKGWDDRLNPVNIRVWFIGQMNPTDFTPKYLGDRTLKLVQDRRENIDPPEGTTLLSFQIDPHLYPVGYSFEPLSR